MKVACPNCGAENPLDNPGQEVVCISCFSVWVPEPGSEITEAAPVGIDEAEDTYQGHTINIEPSGQEIDPLNLDLGVSEADAEEATAFAMEAVSLPDTAGGDDGGVGWPEATQEVASPLPEAAPEEPADATQTFEAGDTTADDVDGFTYTRSSTDIIQEESPFGDQEFDAMSQTTIAGADASSGGTESFGAPPSSSDYDDPFADLESPSSASSTDYDDPFAMDESPGGGDAASSLASEDPFAVAETVGDEGGGLDGMEELDFGSLGGDTGGDDGGFEVDGLDPGAAADPEPMADDSEPVADDAPATEGGRKRGRGRARRRKAASGGKAKQIVGVLLAVIVLAGVAMGQFTDMGYFGMNLILGGGETAQTRQLPPRPERPKPKKPEGPATVSDAPADYVKRIADLEGKIKDSPKDKALLHELAKTLLNFQERHKSAFSDNPEYAKRLGEVLDPEQLQADKQLLIQKLLAEGKNEEAKAALEALKAEKISDPKELYIAARVAQAEGKTAAAIANYKRALELNPGYEPAIIDLAQIHLDKKEIAEAKALYTKLLEMNPAQTKAQVELAQIALFEKNYEGAKELAAKALETAQKAGDKEGIHGAYWLKARLADAQGKAEDRLAALEQAIAVKPKDEQTVLALAETLTKQGNLKAALVRLQAAETAGLKSPAFFQSLIDSLVANGKEDEAKKKLEDGLAAAPDDTGLMMIQAEEKIRGNQINTAKGLYAKVIEIKPGLLAPYLGLTKLLVAEGKLLEATELLEGAVDKVEDKQPLLEKTAELQMQSGKANKARETMAKILKVNPNDTGVKGRFASLLKGLGVYDESARYYEALETAGALEPEQAMDYAEVLSELGKRDRAMGHVDGILAADPMNLRANILRGHLNTLKGDHKKASEDLKRALSVKEDSASALYYSGLNELDQDRVAEAISFLTKANTAASDDLKTRDALARAYTASGTAENQRAALAQYSYIIERYQGFTSLRDQKQIDSDVYLRRGRIYFKLNQHNKALKDFEEAVKLDPDRVDLLIENAKTLQKMQKSEEAGAFLRKVLSLNPGNSAAHYYLGESLMKKNDLKGAEKHFNKAVATGGADFPVAYRHLGYIYRDQKLMPIACNNFKKFVRFAPETNYEREEIARLVEKICK